MLVFVTQLCSAFHIFSHVSLYGRKSKKNKNIFLHGSLRHQLLVPETEGVKGQGQQFGHRSGALEFMSSK